MANKIKFGLSKAGYAKITKYDEKTQTYTFGPVKWLPGAVSLTLDPEGSTVKIHADNIVYYTSVTNAGYSGDLELIALPDDFRKDILGEEEVDGVLVENSDIKAAEFAFVFQINGDAANRAIVMWRCTAERPSVAGETTEDTTEPQNDSITITVMPRENDHNVKGTCYMPEKDDPEYDTKKAKYDNWFKEIWQPAPKTSGGTEVQPTSARSSKQESSLL